MQYRVVPANAGTHTPRRLVESRRSLTSARNRYDTAYGFAAFAGTTRLYPLFLSPAEIPLMVSWMPRSTCSSGFCARCSFNSSTCTWLSGSR